MINLNLQTLLIKKWIKLKELSEITGLSQQQLINIKKQRIKKISLSTIEKLCKWLNCQPNDLFIIK